MAVKPTYEIGKEVEAYCSKCKYKMVHIITAVVDNEIKKVICKGCNSTHVYRTEKPVKSLRVKKSSESTPALTTVRRPRKRDWASLRARISESQIIDYNIKKDFTSVQSVNHKKFGVGIITKILSDKKIEVIFENGTKVLAQNWV